MMICWLIIIAAVVLFFKMMPSRWGYNNDPSNESALELLRRRYAYGDIIREEYEERRQVLKHS
jgi:putative membrane protein